MTNTSVGFSGTRKGMSENQKYAVREVLDGLAALTLHHGDCVGADAEAHEIAVACGFLTVAHPPENPSLRAYCRTDGKMLPLPYLERDRAIVDATYMLIAAPESATPDKGGTWYTIRYAMSQNKPVIIIPKGA